MLIVLAWAGPGSVRAVAEQTDQDSRTQASGQGSARDVLWVVCAKDYEPLTLFGADGEPAGMIVDLWRLWSVKTGVTVHFLFTTWQDSLDAVRDGRADIHSGLFRSPERQVLFDYSQPYYAIESGLILRSDLGRLSKDELDGLRVAVLKGSYQEQYMLKRYPGVTLVPFDLDSRMYQAAADGKVDGLLGELPAFAVQMVRMGITGRYEPLPWFRFSGRVHAAVAKGETDLLALVDQGLTAISLDELRAIELRWIRDQSARYFQPGVSLVRLTAEQEAWMAENRLLRVAVAPDLGPVVFVNARGEVTGAARQVLDLVSSSLGTELDFVVADPGVNPADLVVRGLADAACIPAGAVPAETRDTVPLAETESLVDFPSVLVTRLQAPFVTGLPDLAGRALAVAEGDTALKRIKKEFPEIEVRVVAGLGQGLEALSNGEVFAVLGDLGRIAHLIRDLGLTNLKVAARTKLPHYQYVLVAPSADITLLQVLAAGLKSVDPAEQERIGAGWLKLRFEHSPDPGFIIRVVLQALAAVLLVSLAFLFWNRRLKREARDRAQAEAALRVAEHRYRAIFENAPVGIFQTTLDGEVLRVNPEMVRIGGYNSIEEVMGTVGDLSTQWYADPADRDFIVDKVRRQGFVTGQEYRAKRKDGSVIWVSMSAKANLDERGRPHNVDGFVLDVTSRKQTEEALLKRYGVEKLVSSLSTRFLNMGPESLNAGVEEALSSLGRILGVERCYVFLFSSDMKQMNLTHEWRNAGANGFVRPMLELSVDKAPWFTERLFEGRYIAISELDEIPAEGFRERRAWEEEENIRSLAVVPLRYRNRLLGFLGCDTLRASRRWEASDIAVLETMAGIIVAAEERVRHERDILLARDEAEAANRAKSAFLASMSHEIRTPMNAILGMAEVLADTDLNKDQRHYVKVFRNAAENLLGIIDDILNLSKVEAGRVDLENIDFDLGEMVAQSVAPQEMKAKGKGLGFTVRVAPEAPELVRGDPMRVKQILANLADNAIKFTDAGFIEVLAERADPVHPFEIRFTVRDTGIGIPEDKREVVFESFIQADSTTTRRYGGTGLGLAICKRLATLMGGRIWVEGRADRGSVFRVVIPFGRPMTSLVASGVPAEARDADMGVDVGADVGADVGVDLGGARILLVDDSEFTREVVRAFLKHANCHLTEAVDGAEALDLIDNEPFDLVLMDMQMPVMDGIEAVVRLREREERYGSERRAVVVGITAYTSPEEEKRCMAVGCDAFLYKPVKQAELLAVLGHWLAAPEPD